ncbi:CaiB/BaiF CoA transferase family protein [Fusobacterium russii]|uniref:CaiB/BaiF CoA transferase family protein n=1 Tax=Fusobacterium russii TaxID=854 RepID=UPI00039DBB7F|nr:CoA transferase [Fusobacterium russii]
MNENKGLLEGIVVLDLTRVLAGPYCGTLIADMGATVIKVENPTGGDDSRSMGPFINGHSVYYANFNRSKLGCTLNLKTPEGKEIFKELVKKADVVIENYRPGTMEKLGLGYDELKKVNPSIIYGAVSGFGHTGPLSKRAGYDIIGQAMGGLMSTTGWPGGPATRSGTPLGDVLGGLNLAIGILAALINREKTGLGEKVDVALVDSVASAMENITMIYQATGRIPQRIGNRYESTYPYDSFPAKDGDVIIAAGNNKLFAILCEIMGQAELKNDPRFIDVKNRVTNHDDLFKIVSNWSKEHTVDEIDKKLNDAGCPASIVNTIDRLVVDKQIAGAREMFPEIDQPGIGKLQITACPQKLTRTKSYPRKPAPLLGEDNIDIYGKMLGFDENRINELKEKGII